MLFNWSFTGKTLLLCIKAIPTTLLITLISLLLAALPAYLIAETRIKKRKIGTVIARIYVSFMRGTPIVLQILIIYSMLPSLLNMFFQKYFPAVKVFDWNPIIYAIVVFTLNTTANLSEVFRSALLTVDKGQYEAALSIGLTKFQAYRRIVIPQALICAVPNMSDLTVALIKNTSLAFLMTVKDITAVAKIQASYGFNYIEAYLDIFIIYIVVCSAVQFLYRMLEKKLKKTDTEGKF